MDISFKGKRVLVTGAGAGFGRAVSLKLAECGAQVIGLSRTAETLETLKEECPSIQTLCLDLETSDWESTKKAVSTFLPIHCLVNNAGIGASQSLFSVTPEIYDRVFQVNLKSVICISQVVAKDMVERGQGGTIVNVSSQAAQAALSDHLVYSASKAALDSVTRSLALELGPHQIRVNSVNPTVVLTKLAYKRWSNPANAGPMIAKIPQGRYAEIKDVVHAIVFLLSDKSDMINGTTLPVDGGFLAT